MSLIEITGVSKSFGTKLALDNIDLTIEGGEIFGFLGPNGAGKSTTIRCVMGLIYPTSGTITIDGENVDRAHASYRSKIGYVPSDLHLNESWTGQEHINFVHNTREDFIDPAELIERLSIDVNEKVKQLSTGNKQKLALLLGMLSNPKILILDEPTKGLDPLFQEEIYEILLEFKAQGGCVFFSSHNLSEVERLCDRIGVIRDGKIVANETMESLRHLHVHEVTVMFAPDGELPDLSSFGEIISTVERTVTMRVEGDINPFLREIAKYNVADVGIEHANLEDTFMHFYRESS
jgi:ABC-2 type transport system ATP-binding protein